MSDEKPKRKYAVGLSFPGEVRDFARKLYKSLSRKFGKDRVFLDEKFTAKLLGVDLDNKLRSIYREECFLLVPIFCRHYEKKWCRIEWRTIRGVILESKNEDRVIPVALDDTWIAGWEPTDYSIRADQYSVSEIAGLIHDVFIDRSGEAPLVARTTTPKGRNAIRAGRGASQSADRPSPTTNTAIPQHERCLVRVFVNNRLSGSGVLIAGRLIVTSRSVVQRQNELVKVQFYSHAGGAPSKQGKSTGSVKGLHDVAVVAEVWQAGEPHQVVILRLADDVPQGATPTSLCDVVSSTRMRVECRGVSAEMTASGQGTPPLVTGLVTTSGTLQLELENDAHREGLNGGPVFCARTKQIVGLVGGMAETVTTPASVFSVLRSSATLWAEFLRSETQHVHSQAEQRLNERIREALRGKSSLWRSILSEFRIVEGPDPPVETVIGCLKKMPITKLANGFSNVERLLQAAREASEAQAAVKLYYAIIAQVIDPLLVRDVRSAIRVTTSQAADAADITPFTPSVVLIPCRDRTILELILAAADGRSVGFVSAGINGLPRSRNELAIDDLPEGGIEMKPEETAEDFAARLRVAPQVLREKLHLDTLANEDPETIAGWIRRTIESQYDTDTSLFAVIRGYSNSLRRVGDWMGLERHLKEKYPKLVLVDMTGVLDPDIQDRYQDALLPMVLNNLRPDRYLPESSP